MFRFFSQSDSLDEVMHDRYYIFDINMRGDGCGIYYTRKGYGDGECGDGGGDGNIFDTCFLLQDKLNA